MEIRPVTADEWPRWREVRLRMLRDDATFFSSRYEDAVREPDDVWQRWVAEAEAGETKRLFAAVSATGEWIGVVGAFVRIDPSEVHLVAMWVDPGTRGRGVARKLIRAVAEWAKERSAARVLLFVQEANAPGRVVYARAGFTPTGDRTPIGSGRTGFKILLAADVERLLAP